MKNFYINKKVNPKGLKKDEYDVVIIGAGIGGLVCGCYLAKAGLKVLIVEKNDKPGGYCGSFYRSGYQFDVGAHYLGSLREEGQLRKIFNELNIDKKINLIRNDTIEKIITPFCCVEIKKDIKETYENFQASFPNERRAIKDFFGYIINFDITKNGLSLRDKTFYDFLCMFFKDKRIKSTLSIFLGNLGIPSFETGVLSGIILFKEYVLDNGYYPEGGMHKFPDALVETFQYYGGNISFSCEAKRINLKNNHIDGILLYNNMFLKTRYIVSNCDARQTFLKLIGYDNVPSKFVNLLYGLLPSPSAVVIYLGINPKIEREDICNIWHTAEYNIDEVYKNVLKGKIAYGRGSMVINIPTRKDTKISLDKEVISIITLASYQTEEFWKRNKNRVKDELTQIVEKLMPEIRGNIDVAEIATPPTFNKYSKCFKGAIYGWAATKEQVKKNLISQKTVIEGLYMVGQWASGLPNYGGVPTVAVSGKNAARLILRKNILKKNY